MDEIDEIDLRPSPWPLHTVIVLVVAVAYAVLAWGAWPPTRPPVNGRLETGLSVLVAIGEGAAMGAILMMGAVVLMYVGLTTVFLSAAPPRLRNPWLVHGVTLGVGALVIAIAAIHG